VNGSWLRDQCSLSLSFSPSLSLSLSLTLSDSNTHSPSQPPSLLDAIDSHPETSTRRSWASIVDHRQAQTPAERNRVAGDGSDHRESWRLGRRRDRPLRESHPSNPPHFSLLTPPPPPPHPLLSIIVTRDPLLPVARSTTHLLCRPPELRCPVLRYPPGQSHPSI